MDAPAPPTRRTFLHAAGGLAVGSAGLNPPPPAVRPTTVGLIADTHHGLAPDADRRLDAFLAEAAVRKPDLLMQLGDFCHPPRAVGSAAGFLRAFDGFPGPRYHVLGNHDLDLARGKREVLDAWGMTGGFYAFDHGGFHFAVLDCNFVRTAAGRFADWTPGRRYESRIHPDQLDWLAADLAGTRLPTVVVSHQGFGPPGEGGVVPDADAIRGVIAAANGRPGGGRVVLCLHGHNHHDAARVVAGVHYVELNSASYLWVGEEYGRMAAYRDPLFAFLTLDPRGVIRLTGRASRFAAPTPADRGFPGAEGVSASITDRELRFTPPAAG